MTDFEDRYHSMPEICKYLGIRRDSALKLITNKGIPAHKVGKTNMNKIVLWDDGRIYFVCNYKDCSREMTFAELHEAGILVRI